MKDFGVSVLEQYDIDVKDVKRIRGGMMVESQNGYYMLKEANIDADRVDFLVNLYKEIEESGFSFVDAFKANKEGAYLSVSEDGTKYLLKRWFLGHECDVKKDTELMEGIELLAFLHTKMKIKDMELKCSEEENPLRVLYERHNRELRKIFSFVQKRSVKNVFEAELLKGYEKMYEQAQYALEKTKTSIYSEVYKKAREEHEIAHGDFNYHNIIFGKYYLAVVGFERAHFETQLSDLYYFFRKTMEKHHYDSFLGERMLNAYQKINPIGKAGMDYLAVRLSYPEKYWKTTNAYYHSNKSWISDKQVEKLRLTMKQSDEKKLFLKDVFSCVI